MSDDSSRESGCKANVTDKPTTTHNEATEQRNAQADEASTEHLNQPQPQLQQRQQSHQPNNDRGEPSNWQNYAPNTVQEFQTQGQHMEVTNSGEYMYSNPMQPSTSRDYVYTNQMPLAYSGSYVYGNPTYPSNNGDYMYGSQAQMPSYPQYVPPGYNMNQAVNAPLVQSPYETNSMILEYRRTIEECQQRIQEQQQIIEQQNQQAQQSSWVNASAEQHRWQYYQPVPIQENQMQGQYMQPSTSGEGMHHLPQMQMQTYPQAAPPGYNAHQVPIAPSAPLAVPSTVPPTVPPPGPLFNALVHEYRKTINEYQKRIHQQQEIIHRQNLMLNEHLTSKMKQSSESDSDPLKDRLFVARTPDNQLVEIKLHPHPESQKYQQQPSTRPTYFRGGRYQTSRRRINRDYVEILENKEQVEEEGKKERVGDEENKENAKNQEEAEGVGNKKDAKTVGNVETIEPIGQVGKGSAGKLPVVDFVADNEKPAEISKETQLSPAEKKEIVIIEDESVSEQVEKEQMYAEVVKKKTDTKGVLVQTTHSKPKFETQVKKSPFDAKADVKAKKQTVKVGADAKKEDAKKEDAKKEDAKKEDAKKEDAKKEDTKKEDTKKEIDEEEKELQKQIELIKMVEEQERKQKEALEWKVVKKGAAQQTLDKKTLFLLEKFSISDQKELKVQQKKQVDTEKKKQEEEHDKETKDIPSTSSSSSSAQKASAVHKLSTAKKDKVKQDEEDQKVIKEAVALKRRELLKKFDEAFQVGDRTTINDIVVTSAITTKERLEILDEIFNFTVRNRPGEMPKDIEFKADQLIAWVDKTHRLIDTVMFLRSTITAEDNPMLEYSFLTLSLYDNAYISTFHRKELDMNVKKYAAKFGFKLFDKWRIVQHHLSSKIEALKDATDEDSVKYLAAVKQVQSEINSVLHVYASAIILTKQEELD